MKATDLRKGNAVNWENATYLVHDIQRVSKGNWRSYMAAKFKNVKTGQVIDVRLRVDDDLDVPFLTKKPMEFLYREGDNLVMMDLETYDQIHVPASIVGDVIKFLKPNERVEVSTSDGQVFEVALPFVVELAIAETTPQVRGATATNQLKDATLETGARVRVPPFVETGERIRVDTRTGEYVERAR